MSNPFEQQIFSFLAEADPLPATPADVVMGFGMFDLALARLCGDLISAGHARLAIFTGGRGAGTGRLTGAEADAWRDEVRRSHPGLPDDRFILESASTNTGENVSFTAALLIGRYPEWAFGQRVRSVVLVASPTRLRRVHLTMRRQQPGLTLMRRTIVSSLESERIRYAAEGVDLTAHMIGELDRLEAYAERGWIAREPLPVEISHARDALRRLKPFPPSRV